MVLPPAIDKQNEGVEPNCARPGAVMLQQVERGSAVFIQRNNLPVELPHMLGQRPGSFDLRD